MFKGNNVWYSTSDEINEGNLKGIIIGKDGMGKTYIKNIFLKDENDLLFESQELFDEEQNLINSEKLVDFLNNNPINRIFIAVKFDRNSTMKEWIKQYVICFKNYKDHISVVVTFCPSNDMEENWNQIQRGVLRFYGLQSLCLILHVDSNQDQVTQALRHLMKQYQQIQIDIKLTKLKELTNECIHEEFMQLQQLVGQIQMKSQIQGDQQQVQIYPEQDQLQPTQIDKQQVKQTFPSDNTECQRQQKEEPLPIQQNQNKSFKQTQEIQPVQKTKAVEQSKTSQISTVAAPPPKSRWDCNCVIF
ncbi:hypothetical protein pb186bvf_000995 [Paramecium bursaria]